MFPPRLRNTVVSKPNTEWPINAKETYLKIHTRTHNLHPPNRLLIRVEEKEIKVATGKRGEGGYEIETRCVM